MSGQLGPSGVYEISDLSLFFSGTVSLTSSDANRKIELSINGGATFFQPQYDVDEADCIGLVIKAPITNIRFTGAPTDVWRSLV